MVNQSNFCTNPVSDVCLSVVYIGPKLRTEKPRKTKIGTEVAHVTRDSDTTFKVQGHRGGCILWRPPTQLVISVLCHCKIYTCGVCVCLCVCTCHCWLLLKALWRKSYRCRVPWQHKYAMQKLSVNKMLIDSS